MNEQKERGSDSKNFGKRIIEFGVVLKSHEGLKLYGLFCKFPKKNQKTGFSGIIFG
jgi:hypothetical protein